MTAGYERPDLGAVTELETLTRVLLKELASWRKRCLKAEADVQAFRSAGGGGADLLQLRGRIVELETENQALRRRVQTARERVQGLAGRLSFLDTDGEAP